MATSGEEAMLAEIVARFREKDAHHRWECAVAAAAGACVAAFALRCTAAASCVPSLDAERKQQSSPRIATRIVLSLGISVLDYSVVLDDFPKTDTKQVATKQITSGGGNAANTAVCVSRLGLPAQLMSKVGDDPAGKVLLRELLEEGVCCTRTVQVATCGGALEDREQGVGVAANDCGRNTVTCFVLVTGDTRTIVSMPHSQRVTDLDPDWVERQLLFVEEDGRNLLARVGLLQLDGRHPAAAARAARLARDRDVPVLVEAELRSADMMSKQGAELAELLSLADYVVASEEYPTAVTGLTDPASALKAVIQRYATHARWAVVTRGEKGCVAINRKESVTDSSAVHDSSAEWETLLVPAFALRSEEVVDTTGAGDAFIGGLAAANARGLALEPALRVASWVAAQNCKGEGARGGMPSASCMPAEIAVLWHAQVA